MPENIPYARQDISDEDVQSVVEVLRSDYLTQGPAVPRFEDAFRSRVQSPYGVAVTSATAALHIACLALDVGPGDVVWTSPISFVASANCGLYCGAEIDFVDIDSETFNMSPTALRNKLEDGRRRGKLPKVVIPVHMAGRPCDMRMIDALAEEYGFRVIEDASHAVGASLDGAPVGSSNCSDITVFSFHPVKIMTTGEGGLLTTRDSAIARRLQLLRSHGITRDASEMTSEVLGSWYYEQQMLGFNYRMTEIQAALGLSQLARIDEFLNKRRELVSAYHNQLSHLNVQLPDLGCLNESAWHLYILRTPLRDRLVEYLSTQRIVCNLHYMPIYRQPYYGRFGFKPDEFPESERYFREAVTIPLFPSMTPAQYSRVVEAVTNFFKDN
jgi:UDP-4-amino-4,6-dideoxy-N-acetyl-beta-L-altrosamine transaminase